MNMRVVGAKKAAAALVTRLPDAVARAVPANVGVLQGCVLASAWRAMDSSDRHPST